MPTARAQIVQAVEASGVVAIVRLTDARSVRQVASALIDGGVTIIEVTMTVPNAVGLIAELAGSLEGIVIGAGTVTDAKTAEAVIRAGARFVVSPVFRPDVIATCHAHDVAAMPGCFSPTEILSAWELGADIIKVFPATALGPSYLKDVRAPLPQVKLMPTGGVSRDNAADWIRAGAVALGVGTALVDPKVVAAGRFDQITANARQFVEAVRSARSGATVVR
jgi:2-dehydro-3-deoxyphosphogluconate aldolase/(4S)-4-hydroxy-2-oxoglutarate aldolase